MLNAIVIPHQHIPSIYCWLHLCKIWNVGTFYDYVVSSSIFYGVVCWSRSISAACRKKLDTLIKKAKSIVKLLVKKFHPCR